MDTTDSFMQMLDMLLSEDDDAQHTSAASSALDAFLAPQPASALDPSIPFQAPPAPDLDTSLHPIEALTERPGPARGKGSREFVTTLAQRESHQRSRVKRKNEVQGIKYIILVT
jgi:hypothetical protein